jgi:transposase-like protein
MEHRFMGKIRKRHGREFKMQVVLSLLKGDKTLAQLSSEYGVHATQLKEWREQGLEAMKDRFSARRGRKQSGVPTEEMLYEEIGRLKIDLDFLSGKLGGLDGRRG